MPGVGVFSEDWHKLCSWDSVLQQPWGVSEVAGAGEGQGQVQHSSR